MKYPKLTDLEILECEVKSHEVECHECDNCGHDEHLEGWTAEGDDEETGIYLCQACSAKRLSNKDLVKSYIKVSREYAALVKADNEAGCNINLETRCKFLLKERLNALCLKRLLRSVRL